MSASFFSYIDTALRIVYINRNLRDDKSYAKELNGVLKQIETSPEQYNELMHKVMIDQVRDPKVNSLLYHESHHYWQSLFYPFLFVLHWVEFKILFELKQTLRYKMNLQKLEIDILPEFAREIQSMQNMSLTSVKFRLDWTDGLLKLNTSRVLEEAMYDSNVFCLIDFIEDVTTLFEYKCSTDSNNALDYFRWIQNPMNKGYKKLYKFLYPVIGKEETYHLMPIIVQLSFNTTKPAEAFCYLTNYIISNKKIKVAKNIFESLKTILVKNFPVLDRNPLEYDNIENLPSASINLKMYGKIVDVAHDGEWVMHYPLAVHARKYINELSKNPDLEQYLIHNNKAVRKYLLGTFCPFAIYFNFLDVSARGNFFKISSDYSGKQVLSYNSTYEKYISELQNIKEITVSLFTNINIDTPHNCEHIKCSYYKTNLCRRWNTIPKRPEECSFPTWFIWAYGYKIDTKKNLLVRLDKQDQELRHSEYKAHLKEKDKNVFDYVIDKNKIISLLINPNVIEKGGDKYFQDFVSFLILNHKFKIVDLFGRIIFHFKDFESPKTPLCKISIINEWLHRIKIATPELLFYLNFDPIHDQRTHILPNFVTTIFKKDKTGMFEYRIDEKKLTAFIMSELSIMSNFCKENNIKNDLYLNELIQNLTGEKYFL